MASAPTTAPIIGPRPFAGAAFVGTAAAGGGATGFATVGAANTPALPDSICAARFTATVAALADGQLDPLRITAGCEVPLRKARGPDSRSRLTRWRSARRSAAV